MAKVVRVTNLTRAGRNPCRPRLGPQMRCGNVFIYVCRRLRANVSIRAVEIESIDSVRAQSAREYDAVAALCVDRIISHNVIVVLYSVRSLIQWLLRLTLVTHHAPRAD